MVDVRVWQFFFKDYYICLLVHDQMTGEVAFNPSLNLHGDLIGSSALTNVFGIYGTYLLPQMYSVGSPAHPSYPANHAVACGAGVTILKAFFDENFAIPS